MNLFSLTVRRLGSLDTLPDDFPGPLIFLYFTNTGILGIMKLKTLSFATARNLLRIDFGVLMGL
jgi:hypothetical protein